MQMSPCAARALSRGGELLKLSAWRRSTQSDGTHYASSRLGLSVNSFYNIVAGSERNVGSADHQRYRGVTTNATRHGEPVVANHHHGVAAAAELVHREHGPEELP